MGKALAKRVLLIGWDAADWKVINPLIDAGKMPALEKLINGGVIGNLATLDPPLSPMLWTSIATGKRADKHGVLGFAEPDLKNNAVRPVNVTSRKVKAIWNILHNQGKRSNVVSWWPSHPAEPLNGVYVSNFFHKAGKKYGEQWNLPDQTIHPESMVKELLDLRIHPGELTSAHILPFVPDAAKVDQDKDKRLAALAKIIAEASSVHAVATHLMQNTTWDFMAVYLDAIDHFCHGYMKFHPPKMPHVPDNLYELYKDVVVSGYIFHDMMLERLMKLAGEDTTIMLISDHGFHSDHLRPPGLPKFAAAPALEHNPLGVFILNGNGVKKDERIYGASLLDITPTLLTLFGLPVGKDMDGKILLNAFETPPQPAFINSWEEEKGDFGTHPEHEIEDSYAGAEAMQQLIDLGYVEDPGDDKKKAMEKTSMEAKYNLSRVYASSGNHKKAVEILEELRKTEQVEEVRFMLDLLYYYLELKRFPEAREIVDEIRQDEKKSIPTLDMLEGILLVHEDQPVKALELLKKAEKSTPHFPMLHVELGKVYIKTQRYHDARGAFLTAIEIDEGNAVAYNGLAVSQLRMGLYEEAAENALNAIGLIYHFPAAHHHLGEAMYNMEKYEEAIQAFEICIRLAPRMQKARSWIIKIYEEKLNQPENAEEHRNILKDMMKGEIIIVSGLPRSGTSMMMQMLGAGGIELMTDHARSADDNNPKGYFELEKVKSLAKEHSWMEDAQHKVVKVIAQLLYYLPNTYRYKVVFMNRDMKEVIQSQQKMLGRKGDTYPVAIAKAFEKELEKVKVWADREPVVDILYLEHNDVIQNPEESAKKVAAFISQELDVNEMIKVVDPTLYRSKG